MMFGMAIGIARFTIVLSSEIMMRPAQRTVRIAQGVAVAPDGAGRADRRSPAGAASRAGGPSGTIV